jgi:hypothetical protein
MLPGEKAKLLDLIDNGRAERAALQPMYSIEITVGKSPKLGVKCGGISVFRLNSVAQDFEDKLNPKDFKPEDLVRAQARAQEIQDEVNSQTEVMHMDPIMFKETEGRWLPWAIDKALSLYDRFGGSAKISLKCPRLRIRVERSPRDVARLRGNVHELFPVVRDIDVLLEKGYAHDPWRNVVRRGRIDAEMAKR